MGNCLGGYCPGVPVRGLNVQGVIVRTHSPTQPATATQA